MAEMTLLDLQGLEMPEPQGDGGGHGGGDSDLSVTGCNGHSGISLLCGIGL